MEIELVVLANFQSIDKVAAFIEDSGPEPELSTVEDCPMTEWLKDNPRPDLDEPHEDFHRVLIEAVEKKKQGQIDEANDLLNRAFLLYSQLERAIFE